MKKPHWIALLIVVVVIVAIAAATYITTTTFENTLTFTIRDAISKEWVHDSTMLLQNRSIRGFFAKEFTFTGLKPGEDILKISAPAYVSREIPVEINRGQTVIGQTIEMEGYEIPTLESFIVFESAEEGGLFAELRPVGTDKMAVLNHPCIDIRILVMVSAQILEGEFAREKTEEGSTRGEILYRGELEWRWDSDPNTTFRYTAPIPVQRVEKSDASFWVLDYLILVPDVRKITKDEVDRVIEDLEGIDIKAIPEFLAGFEDRLKFYLNESWNVVGGLL